MIRFRGHQYREAGGIEERDYEEDARRQHEFPEGAYRDLPLEDPDTVDWSKPGFREGSVYKDPLYHGSDQRGLTELRPDMDMGEQEWGIYLTPNRKYARVYGSCIYTCLINVQRPLYIESKSDLIGWRIMTKQDADAIVRDGYDSLVLTDESEVVVFDPTRVHVMTYECE